MPNRIIKESICSSESISKLSWFQECFFTRLIVNCDDYGRFDARPEVLQRNLFQIGKQPPLKDIIGAVEKLAELGTIQLYEVEGKPYLCFPTWENHQRIRAKHSKWPAPANLLSYDSNLLTYDSRLRTYVAENTRIREYENTRSEKRARASESFTPPSLSEVKAYFAEKGFTISAEAFYEFYNAADWTDSKGAKVRSWKQKAITWQNHEKDKPKAKNKPIAPAQTATAADIDNMRKLIDEMRGETSA